MPDKFFGGVQGGLLDESQMLDSGEFPVLSEQSVERDLTLREFEPNIQNRVAPLRERQAATLSEAFDADFATGEKAVEIAEIFFPPLGIANFAHDSGAELAKGLLDESPFGVGLGTGLLAMALVPGAPKAVKAVKKGSDLSDLQTAVEALPAHTLGDEVTTAIANIGVPKGVFGEELAGDVAKAAGRHINIAGSVDEALKMMPLVDDAGKELVESPFVSSTLIGIKQKIGPEASAKVFASKLPDPSENRTISEKLDFATEAVLGKNIGEEGDNEFFASIKDNVLQGIKKHGGIQAAAKAEKLTVPGSVEEKIISKMAGVQSEVIGVEGEAVGKAVADTLGELKGFGDMPQSEVDDLFQSTFDDVQDLIESYGSVEEAIDNMDVVSFPEEVHDTLVTLFNAGFSKPTLPVAKGFANQQSLKQTEGFASDVLIASGPQKATQQNIVDLTDQVVKSIDEHGGLGLAWGAETTGTLKHQVISKLLKDATTSSKATTKQVANELKAKIPSDHFGDLFKSAVKATEHNPEIEATSQINEITQEALDFLVANGFDIEAAFQSAATKGPKHVPIASTLFNFGKSKNLSAFTKPLAKTGVIQDPSTIKKVIPATSEHARQLTSDIQTGIQSLNIPDAVKVDKFLERKGFNMDLLARKGKVILNEDIEDLFQLKEAVFDGNVNDVMNQITQRNVGRMLRIMPKKSQERKDWVQALERRKESGFTLKGFHATNKDLIENLVEEGKFSMDMIGANYGSKKEPAVFLSTSPEVAEHFGSVIMPLVVKADNPMIIDLAKLRGAPTNFSSQLTKEAIDAARRAKKDVVIIRNIRDNGGLQDQILVLDPKKIKSIFAKFKEFESGDIGAGIAGASVLPFAMQSHNRESEPES